MEVFRQTHLAKIVYNQPGLLLMDIDMGFDVWQPSVPVIVEGYKNPLARGSEHFVQVMNKSSIIPALGVAIQQEDKRYHYPNIEIHSIYDADTLRINILPPIDAYSNQPLLPKLKRMNLRLADVDAWELRGEERPLGLIAKEALRLYCEGKRLAMRTVRDTKGKYGRYLAWLYANGVNVNKWLIEQGHAVPYT